MCDQELGKVEPTMLVSARLELHWAAQVAGSVGMTYGVAAPDFSHTSLTWIEDLSALGGTTLDGGQLRGALRIDDFSLLVVDENGATRKSLPGETLEAIYRWLSGEFSSRLNGSGGRSLERFGHEMPEHPVAHGGAFSGSPAEHFAELRKWYETAFGTLRRLSNEMDAASPVRCWPHHFDVATLIQIDPSEGGEEARSIGVGMSPGDQSYSEPYWYVTPWPYPAIERLAQLEHGRWHTDGWIGAVLTGSDLLDRSSGKNQQTLIDDFLRTALSASRILLKDN